MEKHCVIVGSGIAGLSLALKLSQRQPNWSITLITKKSLADCNTRFAQGGIAAVIRADEDSFVQHVNDTLMCGGGLCDSEVVQMVVSQAPKRIVELMEWGMRFDLHSEGNFDLALEGGHTYPRVLHHKDRTGFEIESVLISQIKHCKNIKVLEDHSALDLIIHKEKEIKYCTGIKVCDWKNKTLTSISSTHLILASGGCGQVYANTTNPDVATGDGYVMAEKAGATLRDMRFMQFHPTALYAENKRTVSFLISEAVRGFGAHIIDKHGNRFLYTYDVRGELSTRDKVSSAIMDHMNKTGEKCVFMDLRHLNQLEFEHHFPGIKKELLLAGFDPSVDLIPVTPSAHYQCGGIKVNRTGETDLKNVFAIGEVASTGLHGANRLASNSLLEALVFAHNAMEHIVEDTDENKFTCFQKDEDVHFSDQIHDINLSHLLYELKRKMSASAFSDQKESLQNKLEAIKRLEVVVNTLIESNTLSRELLDLRNLSCTARYILEDKLKASQNTINKTYI